MSSLRDRSNRLRPKSRGKSLTFLSVLALLVSPIGIPNAVATGTQATLGMYLDQPFVQGSYVAEDFPSETSVTTFNEQSYGNLCSFNGATLQPLYQATADCRVQTEINYGGASTTSSTPAVGQYPIPVNYGQVGGGGASIVFSTPQTYFGLWWSAGSAGNEIQLVSGTDVVASTSANDVASTLFGSGSLSAQSGDQYATRLYIRNPVDWFSVGTPTNFADLDVDNSYQTNNTMAPEPFVFIHFIAEPGVTFDRVNLIAPGNGFEFDNFTTSSSTSITAPSRLVLQRQLYEPTYVEFDANGGSGALPRQYSIDGASANLQSACLDYNDPTRCITPLNNSYSTQLIGWNTAPDGSGDAYYFDNWIPYPFTQSATLYAQWSNTFNFYNLTNPDADGSNVWDYTDFNTQSSTTVTNFGDITLPSRDVPGYYLEGWYSFDTFWNLVRVGSPGEVVSASSYTTWDSNVFARFLEDTTPPSVDALTPQLLLVYPRATSVELPNMPLSGASTASICLFESDEYGNQVSSSLQFTDLASSSTGFSTSFTISSNSPLVTGASKYVRVTVSPSADTNCSSGNSHVVELKLLGADLSSTVELNFLSP